MSAPIFPILPDGGSTTTESMEWLSTLQTAYNGTETASAGRDFPLLTISASYKGVYTGDSATALALLLAGDRARVPLPMHAASILAADALDYGYAAGGSAEALAAMSGGAGTLVLTQTAGVWPALPAGYAWVAPLAPAVLAATRQAVWETSNFWTADATFRLENFQQLAPPAFVGPLSLVQRHNWTVTVQEDRDAMQDLVDFGRRFEMGQRYVKRKLTLSLALRGRDGIQAYRSFLWAAKGRANHFSYHFPGDAMPSTWRLADDTVAIEYSSRIYATSQISIVEIQ